MKLSLNYPIADPVKWVAFLNSWQWEVDPIFMGRIAALGQAMGKKIRISSGYRSYDEQVRSYKSTGGHQDEHGNWVGGNGKAAVPGRSWHEFGCAIDTSDSWLKKLDKLAATANQKTLLKFGLYKPLTKGNGTTVYEDWHIQPIECNGVPVAERKTFFVYRGKSTLHIGDQNPWVLLAQMYLNAKDFSCGNPDGDFGPKTNAAVAAFQKANGLQPDGVVGNMTWRKLLYNK